MDEFKTQRKPHPKDSANFFSLLTFYWLLPFLQKDNPIYTNEKNMPNCTKEDMSEVLADRLEKNWNKEISKAKLSKREPSIFRALMITFASKLSVNFCILSFREVYVKMVQPLCLGYLVRYFDGNSDISTQNAYLIGALLFFNIFVLVVVTSSAHYTAACMGIQMKIACCALIYRKCLRLSRRKSNNISTGQIVNLVSNDVNKFEKMVNFMYYLFASPILVVLITVILWKMYLGSSSVVASLFLVISLPFLVATGKLINSFRRATAGRTDIRVLQMTEIINGMRVIKMYAWEPSFSKRIASARRIEMRKIRLTTLLQAVSTCFYVVSTKIAMLAILVPYILSGNTITADKMFVPVTYIYVLRSYVALYMLQGTIILGEALSSMQRIQSFLLRDDLEPYLKNTRSVTNQNGKELKGIASIGNGSAVESLSEVHQHIEVSQVGVTLSNVSAHWEDDKPPVLNNITCKVRNGQLLAIVGPVASGKTSLLHTIIGEFPPKSGIVSVIGKIAYVPQEPWIFSASVKQNILFGQPYDRQKFLRVIKTCEIEEDLHQLPHGEQTLVGEKGVTLSGGQKARLALARAVYFDADVYILDDPLSAVDSRTGRRLYQQCIMGYLKHKAKVLVTHQLQYLQNADDIIILEQGEIIEQGTYNELKKSETRFAALLAHEDKRKECGEERTGENMQEHSAVRFDKEANEVGNVNWRVYYQYLTAGYGNLGLVIMVLLGLASNGLFVFCDWWLAFWTSKKISLQIVNTNTTKEDVVEYSGIWFLQGYALMVGSLIIVTFAFCVFYLMMCLNSCENLHNRMFNSILRSPIQFFDRNPIGRILNRFSRDLGYIDTDLPFWSLRTFSDILMTTGMLILISVVNPWIIIPSVGLVVLMGYCNAAILKYSRAIKRLEGVTKSPVISHLSASLHGMATIRAFGLQKLFQQEFNSHQDAHTATFHLYVSVVRMTIVVLEILVFLFIGCVIILLFAFSDKLDGSTIGLILYQIISLSNAFAWVFEQASETENLMTSAERVLFYGTLSHEAAIDSEPDKKPKENWPEKGYISARAMSLRYDVQENPVLKQLQFHINSKEKIGVVGRTGAGKSSLVAALFRMAEPEGDLFIDGIRTSDIGLHELRRKISIIPQDPFLFKGSVRVNLDPFSSYSDDKVWEALKQAHLGATVKGMNQGLETEIKEGGSNLSAGQKQLICLARALLKRNKILILDEATANVDPITDGIIQKTIRDEFKECTVLTIAHRLHTIIDSDRILVLDKGMLKEFDTPWNLLQNKGLFYEMVQNTGTSTSEMLTSAAREAHLQKQL